MELVKLWKIFIQKRRKREKQAEIPMQILKKKPEKAQ